MSGPPEILLTGATGFIGGTILAHLLESLSPALQNVEIGCLLRGQDRASTLRLVYGNRVRPVVYEGLDDISTTTNVAAQYDLVINTSDGYHTPSAVALIRGLAQRKASTGRDVWMVHTSGTSNLIADLSVTRKAVGSVSSHEFNDMEDDVYGFEKELETKSPYAQRTTELSVIDLGLELGVNTIVIMSPTVYGIGSGLFNTTSMQIPAYIRTVLNYGRGIVIGDGKGVWDHVHVQDLAELYRIVVFEILRDGKKRLPHGKKGIMFSGNGRHSWIEVAQEVADACVKEGKIQDQTVESMNLGEAATLFSPNLFGADEGMIELALGSNSRTISSMGKSLGWRPTRGDQSWKQGFRDDVQVILSKV